MSINNNIHKVILDTDPGIDDAFALLYLINHPNIDLLGVTTVFGNVATKQSTRNAIDLLEQFNNPHILVAKGAEQPLEKKLHGYAEFVHGDNGLGNVEIPKSNNKTTNLSAAEYIVQQVLNNPNEITICAIAPLTNLALALKIEPKIAELTKQVVIMGGAIRVNGNVNPVAEANINNDPLAADKVLTAQWPVTLIGLDVTLDILLDDVFMNKVKDKSNNGKLLYDISRFYDDFYRNSSGLDGLSCHDATAAIYITNPEYFSSTKGPIRVVYDQGFTEGMTILDSRANYDNQSTPWSDKPKVNVCLTADADKVKNTLLQYLY